MQQDEQTGWGKNTTRTVKPDYPNNLKEIHNRSKDPQENGKLMADFSKNFFKGLNFCVLHNTFNYFYSSYRMESFSPEAGNRRKR